MHRSGPAQGLPFEWRGPVFCALLFFLFTATITFGQDAAEAARQEQGRKAMQQKPSRHVYSEDDLKRQKILTPEDQAKVEARKKQQDAGPAQQNAGKLPSDGDATTQPLGDVARKYRQEKAARAAELAEKKKFVPFPYKVPGESLATAKPGVAPSIETAPRWNGNERSGSTPLSESRSAKGNSRSHARVSPFQPRRSLAPASPTLNIAPPAAPVVAIPIEQAKAPKVVPDAPPLPSTKVRPSVTVPPVSPVVVPPSVHGVAPVVVPGAPSREPAAVPSVATNSLPPLESQHLQRVQVQRGQSWWKLAERYLGNGARWQELRRLNAESTGSPDVLMLGTIVLVPERVQPRRSSPQRTITIEKGDTLWALARQHLGRGSEWMCLAQVNPQLSNYAQLTIGASLHLPSREALESCRSGRLDKLQK
jgi:nucleoid-associated protein YgaU